MERMVVAHSVRVIAVFNGEKVSMKSTIGYAHKKT